MGEYEIHPLTPQRWNDFEDLFGPNGGRDGCWCMWPRIKGSEFQQMAYEGNRRAIRKIVTDHPPGLLAYADGEPVGWISVGRREEFGRVNRSVVTKRLDDQPVWSVVCFYIKPGHRSKGIGSALLDSAIAYARSQGAETLEGYPIDKERVANADAWWGTAAMFRDTGFDEVARRSPTRPFMRRGL